MKKRFKLSLTSLFIGAISTIGLVSIGFASWSINFTDTTSVDGGIIADTLIAMNGFRVISVDSFDYGVYSYGHAASFEDTGEITYNIGITPSQFDPDTIEKMTSNGQMRIYCKFNSLYEVFDKDSNNDFVNFINVTWDGGTTYLTNSNGNNYCFYFVLSGIEDLGSSVEINKPLTFTFSNKLLVKEFGNNQTIADNLFTLSLGKGAFSL